MPAPRLRADFDGDGYEDLAVGAPEDRVPGATSRRHGTVDVLYGSPDGVTVRDQLWHRDVRGVKGIASGVDPSGNGDCCAGSFGRALTSGDFDGDGFSDLAVAAAANPAQDGVPRQPSSLNVLYGSPRGVTAADDQLWSLASPGLVGRAGERDFQSLAVGDFDADGHDDLVFHAQRPDGNEVRVLPGSPEGLTSAGAVVLRRDDPGVRGGTEFRQVMAVGDFDGNGHDDLAATASGPEQAGDVSVLYGGTSGLAPPRQQLWSADSPGVPGRPHAGYAFGSALAAGDLDGDGDDELVVRSQSEQDLRGGRVIVLDGTSAGLTAIGPTPSLRWDTEGLPPTTGYLRAFGDQLAVGDTDGDGREDLVVTDIYARQEPEGACVDPDSGSGPGVQFVLFGTPSGITPAGSRAYGTATLRFAAPPGDGCLLGTGWRVAVADYDGDGLQDVATIVSFHLSQEPGVAVLRGTPSGPQQNGIRVWTATDPGVEAGCCLNQLNVRQTSYF